MDNLASMTSRLVRLRRAVFEYLGSARYSRPALYDLDHKLEPYLGYRNGFFVELGANDGFNQSNSYYLERFLGWRGILIEPIPELFRKAVRARLKSRTFNCACVPFDYPHPDIEMSYAHLMSVVKGSWADSSQEADHIATGIRIQQLEQSYNTIVPARTLTSILDECQVTHIDFLSLDVEGYEANVLRGLDLNRYAPTYILIEARFKDEIDELLSDRYDCIDQLTVHDFMYQLKRTALV